MHALKTIVRLSLCDYYHERLLSVCAVLGLAAVLGPLLVLFGVKSGIINTMAERLIEDPRNREVSPVGSGRYGSTWFSEMEKYPEVAFVIPQTRSIAATMLLYNISEAKPRSTLVDLFPTSKNDPLLEKWGTIPDSNTSVVLSEQAARKLGVVEGQNIVGSVGRSRGSIKEQAKVDLKVVAILPMEAYQREGAFVQLTLLEATEDYRDGLESKALGWPGKKTPDRKREYPSFRLYARSIYDVATIQDILYDQGVEVYTRVEEIELVQRLDWSFTLIFRLISFVAIFGYFASMMSNALANVKRKSRHLGVTRLIGFSSFNIVWFPVVQSMATGFLGTATAVCLYLIVEKTINSLFDKYIDAGEYICQLSLSHLLFAFVLTLSLSILASAYAAFQVSRLEPSEVIRDV